MKTYKILILIGALLGSFACSNDFLDKVPQGRESQKEYYKTKRGIEGQIIAAYSELKNYRYVSNRFFLGDVASDDATKGSEPGDFATAKEIEEFRATASNFQFGSWWWTRLYLGIFYANVAIANVDNATDASEAEKKQMLAEARFLRAYYYSELVRSYGGVPLRTAPKQKKEQPRASAEEVYKLIEEDYSFAAQNLPEKSAYSDADMGRATKGAAQALLGKVYLYQKKWQEAKDTFQKVLNSGEYSLDPNYSSLFTVAGENGVESIFEIQFFESASEANTWRNGGNFTTVFIMPRNIWGWGLLQPTKKLYEAYEEGDPRREATIIVKGEVIEGEKQVGTDDQTGYYSRKDFLPPSQRPKLSVKNSPLNEIVIRLADVYLMYAEAAYHLGDEGTARTYVNKVRARARGNNKTILPDVSEGGTALLKAIYHERRVELALEHHRYWDVIRTGRGKELLHPNFTPGKHELFPIPDTEINASEGVLVQNPGY